MGAVEFKHSAQPVTMAQNAAFLITLIASCIIICVNSSDSDTCRTLRSRKKCRFPFSYNNIEYNSCTGVGHPIGRPWCKTITMTDNTTNVTDSFDVIIPGVDSDWDYCEEGCPVSEECPQGWTNLSSGCYQILDVLGGVDKETAENICRQYGANLVD